MNHIDSSSKYWLSVVLDSVAIPNLDINWVVVKFCILEGSTYVDETDLACKREKNVFDRFTYFLTCECPWCHGTCGSKKTTCRSWFSPTM